MKLIDDGILRAQLLKVEHPCGICGKKAIVLSIRNLEFELDWSTTILKMLPLKRSRYIGLSCGCYAKFHRQVAHIRDRAE